MILMNNKECVQEEIIFGEIKMALFIKFLFGRFEIKTSYHSKLHPFALVFKYVMHNNILEFYAKGF